MVLLLLILYVASIIFKMQLGNQINLGDMGIAAPHILEEGVVPFGSILMSMTWLFFAATLGDNILAIYEEIKVVSYIMAAGYLVMVFLCMFTLLNMLIGILCGVVDQVSQSSKEDVLIDYVKETLLKELENVSPDGDDQISRAEFKVLLDIPNVNAAFEDLEVDPDAFELIEGLVFDPDEPGGEDKQLSFADFLKRVLSMRNSNPARVVDTIEVNKLIKKSADSVVRKLEGKDVQVSQSPQSPKSVKTLEAKKAAALPITQLIEDRFDRTLSMMKMEQARNDAQLSSSIEQALDVRVDRLVEKLKAAKF
jgi:hypothetical protein